MGKKDEQLGMPHGTAQGKLRKQLLFKYLCLAGKNVCHRCEEPMTVENFSIEHVKPWINVSPDLFWDLDNITFSHQRCNYSAGGRASIKLMPREAMSRGGSVSPYASSSSG